MTVSGRILRVRHFLIAGFLDGENPGGSLDNGSHSTSPRRQFGNGRGCPPMTTQQNSSQLVAAFARYSVDGSLFDAVCPRLSWSWTAFLILSVMVCPPPAAAQLTINLVRFSESNHPSLGNLDEEFESHPDNPEFFEDPNGAMLQPILEHAAEQWERIFAPNNHTIEITWFWDNDESLGLIDEDGKQPSTSAIASDPIDTDEDGRIDFAVIRFNLNRTGWWFDPTPNDDSEFNMNQQLYRDIAASTSPDPTWRFPTGAGQPPDLLETAYFGAVPSGSVANNLRDAVTVAMHEMGHALGMLPSHQPLKDEVDADFDFDLDSDKLGGVQTSAYARGHPANTDEDEATGTPTAHLAGSAPP